MSLEHIPLDEISESLSNPRQTFEHIDELAEDIRIHGVLQPILVRPTGHSEGYEVVCGTRRLRAAKKAGLDEIPASIREIEDHLALEMQIVENSQRDDIHPLEEADGYRVLHETHGYDVDDIAAKVGKSKSYVYQRIKLCALADESREAFLAGLMHAGVAVKIARMPSAKLQEQATKRMTTSYGGRPLEQPRTDREASEILQREFMLRLKDAPFDTDDGTLIDDDMVPVPACSLCQKRTGAQRELFADVAGADVCTDPPCFEQKKKAAVKLQLSTAKAEGVRVVPKKEACELMPYAGTTLAHNAPYVSLDARCPQDPKSRTYSKLLGKKPEGLTIAAHPKTGELQRMVPKKGLPKLLKAAGHDFRKKSTSSPSSSTTTKAKTKESAAATREREVQRRLCAKLIEKIVAKAEASSDAKVLDLVVHDLVEHGQYEDAGAIVERRGAVPPEKQRDRWGWGEKELREIVKGMKPKELRGLAVELTINPLYLNSGGAYAEKELNKLAATHGLNLKVIRAAINKQVLQEQKAAATKKKPAKKKTSRKKKAARKSKARRGR